VKKYCFFGGIFSKLSVAEWKPLKIINIKCIFCQFATNGFFIIRPPKRWKGKNRNAERVRCNTAAARCRFQQSFGPINVGKNPYRTNWSCVIVWTRFKSVYWPKSYSFFQCPIRGKIFSYASPMSRRRGVHNSVLFWENAERSFTLCNS